MSCSRAAIIIPSWEGRALLETCLPALMRSTVDANIVVVDNGSKDGTTAWLRDAHPRVQLIQNDRNLGFAVAVNQGIRATNSEWVALLNNDAVVEPTWLERLLETGRQYGHVGAVASRMMFRDNPQVVSSAGIRVDPSGGAWDLLLGQTVWPTAPTAVFGASGGACLYRRAMLADVGLLDEAFFAYLEDVDLAWRAQLRRWQAVLSPDAVVYHSLSATGGEGSSFKRFYLARNKWRVIVKNYPRSLLARNWPAVLVYDGLSIVRSTLERDSAALRGRMASARELGSLLQQRRTIAATRLATSTEIAAAMSSLESPLKLRRRGQLATRLASQHRQ